MHVAVGQSCGYRFAPRVVSPCDARAFCDQWTDPIAIAPAKCSTGQDSSRHGDFHARDADTCPAVLDDDSYESGHLGPIRART
jgi:hypothetical protein